MNRIYQNIKESVAKSDKLLSVLIDPDKVKIANISAFMIKVNQSRATHVFVGGSEVDEGITESVVLEIKKHTQLPVVLFPGDTIQITNKADGILFLSLISGRNPDYLIGKQIEAVSKLKPTNLQVLPTGYLLIENGRQTSVERVSKTKPLKRNDIDGIVNTAKAGELLGMDLIYLEAGSGATHPIEPEIITRVKQELKIPLIVGGGIKSRKALDLAYNAGADMVVIGTAFENDDSFFNEIKL